MSDDLTYTINSLPDELLLWIFRQAIVIKNKDFDAKTYASLTRVCQLWNSIINDVTLLYEMETLFIQNNVVDGPSNLERELISDYPQLRRYQRALGEIYENLSDITVPEQNIFFSNTIKLFNKVENDLTLQNTLQTFHHQIHNNG